MIDLEALEKRGMGCLVPRPGVGLPSCHEHTLCDCETLELVEEIKRLRDDSEATFILEREGKLRGELQRTRELLQESEKLIKAQDRILAAYRLGGNPGNAPQVAMKARAKLAKLRSVSPQGAKL